MRRPLVQIGLGVLVLAAGVLLLLTALGLAVSPALWAVVMACGGVVFGYVFFSDRQSWWAAIPGAALFGLAVGTLMDLDPDGLAQWTEVPVLALIGLGFWAVYLRDHRHWWAIIPGGILLTLSIVMALTASIGGAGTGAAFLLGAAITFVLVAVLPGGGSRRWWSWIPAGALAIAAAAVLAGTAEWLTVLNVIWPIVVIGAGALLIWRAVRRRAHPQRAGSTEDADHL